MSLTWRSDNGTTFPLDGSEGVLAVDEDEGIFTLAASLTIDQRVGDGGVLVNRRYGPRRVVLSFLLEPTGETLLALWSRFFAGLAAGGELDYDGPNGIRTLRDVVLEAPDRSLAGHDLQHAPVDAFSVSLLALDPWWYGPEETLAGGFADPTPWNAALPWDSALPWNGGSSQSITNGGDVATPVLVVVHPGTGSTATISMSVDGVGGWETATIPADTYLTVSGETGRRGPHLGAHGRVGGISDGPIRWNLLTEGSQLFDLPAGTSSLVMGLSNPAGDDSETWSVYWSPRYFTP
jgi:hypothetical protein